MKPFTASQLLAFAATLTVKQNAILGLNTPPDGTVSLHGRPLRKGE